MADSLKLKARHIFLQGHSRAKGHGDAHIPSIICTRSCETNCSTDANEIDGCCNECGSMSAAVVCSF
ncbi:hypothetical protein AgCh_032633 [Apium graveolens]